jgi:hypothetical protein
MAVGTDIAIGNSMNKTLWKYNKITGYWVAQRTVTPETAAQWLKVFKADEPGEKFKVAKSRPTE